MKFHEVLTKNELDVNKIWNFAEKNKPLSMTDRQLEKYIDQK